MNTKEITKNSKLKAIIIVSGRAQVGKSTAANIIQSEMMKAGYHPSTISYAHDIKANAYKLFNWNGLKDERGRRLLTHVGMMGRVYNKNLWVDKSAIHVAEQSKYSNIDSWILSDNRFPNEVKRTKELFPNAKIITIRVKRSVVTPEAGIAIISDDASETSYDNTPDEWFDYIIENETSLFEYINNVIELINKIIGSIG